VAEAYEAVGLAVVIVALSPQEDETALEAVTEGYGCGKLALEMTEVA
jgi:hypothetical protein